ncbi:hypothetical protein Mpsy_0620 [Methanolobus psychrophilus R15]|nr:hypothetical protein Mpsy_0620 [Methanolobus psychrophilus R15]
MEYERFSGEFWTVVVEWGMVDWEWSGRSGGVKSGYNEYQSMSMG